jgi:hypothetical protein
LKRIQEARDTNSLKSADRQTDRQTDRQIDRLGNRKNPSKQGALTDWTAQTDRQVRTW